MAWAVLGVSGAPPATPLALLLALLLARSPYAVSQHAATPCPSMRHDSPPRPEAPARPRTRLWWRGPNRRRRWAASPCHVSREGVANGRGGEREGEREGGREGNRRVDRRMNGRVDGRVTCRAPDREDARHPAHHGIDQARLALRGLREKARERSLRRLLGLLRGRLRAVDEAGHLVAHHRGELGGLNLQRRRRRLLRRLRCLPATWMRPVMV